LNLFYFSHIFKHKLFKNTFIYTSANVINKAIPFFLLPIMTRYLTPTDYGIVAMFRVLLGFVSPFTGLSVHGAISRQYFEKEIDLPTYITNCIYILFCSTAIVSLIVYLFSEHISAISSFSIEWLWVVIVVSFLSFIIKIVLVLWRVRAKPIYYAVFNLLHIALNASLSIWLVVVLSYGWGGRILGQFYSIIVFAIISILVLWKEKWIKFSFNKAYIQNALMFGVPLIPHAFGGFIITMTDRIFITNMVGIADTGIYTVGYQIGMIINLLAHSFNLAWIPWLYGKLKENDEVVKRKIVKFTYSYFVIIIILAVILSVIAPIFLKVFVGKAFTDSGRFVIWIALGYAFKGMYFMVTNYIIYVQKTFYLALITFSTAVINIVLTYFFISFYGTIGAAQATTVSYFISFVLTWVIAAKVYKMPWTLRRYSDINNTK
jgi:O-antigen/teichoic acid export membrane protein